MGCGALGRIYEIGSIPKEWGRSRGSQMAGGTLSSAGVPVAPSILGFMTLSAAEAGLRCCPPGAWQLAKPSFDRLILQWAGVLWFRDTPL